MTYTLYEFMDKPLDITTGILLYLATVIILILFYKVLKAYALRLDEI